MSSHMGQIFHAWPRRGKVGLTQTSIYIYLQRAETPRVVDLSIDAVVLHLVPGAETVGVVHKRACGNAIARSGAITAEAEYWVKDYGSREVARVQLLLPVPKFER